MSQPPTIKVLILYWLPCLCKRGNHPNAQGLNQGWCIIPVFVEIINDN